MTGGVYLIIDTYNYFIIHIITLLSQCVNELINSFITYFLMLFLNITALHTQRPGNYSTYLLGQKVFSYHICFEHLTKYLKFKNRQAEAKVLMLFSILTEQYACRVLND